MAPRVADYLDHACQARPANCGAFLCGWVEVLTGRHPMPGVEDMAVRDWARHVRNKGGMEAVCSELAVQSGFRQIDADDAREGDAAVVMSPTHPTRRRLRETLAIAVGPAPRFAVMAGPFVQVSSYQPLAAWRLADG